MLNKKNHNDSFERQTPTASTPTHPKTNWQKRKRNVPESDKSQHVSYLSCGIFLRRALSTPLHTHFSDIRVRVRCSGVRAHNVAPNDLQPRGATAAIWVKCCIVAFRTRSRIIVGMLEIVGKNVHVGGFGKCLKTLHFLRLIFNGGGLMSDAKRGLLFLNGEICVFFFIWGWKLKTVSSYVIMNSFVYV